MRRRNWVSIGPVAFSPKEALIVERVAAGWNNAEISKETGVSVSVVKKYIVVIYDKVGMSSRLELALWWMKHNPGKMPLEEKQNKPAV